MIHLEFTNKGFDELDAFRDFPTDKVLGVGVVDAKNLQVETAEQIEARIRRGARGGARGPAAGRARLRPGLLQPDRRLRQAAQHRPGRRERAELALTAPGGPGREPRPGPHGLNLGVGDHICGFYRKPSERDDILIPFLVEGLEAGNKCTCVVDSCTPDDVLARHVRADRGRRVRLGQPA